MMVGIIGMDLIRERGGLRVREITETMVMAGE